MNKRKIFNMTLSAFAIISVLILLTFTVDAAEIRTNESANYLIRNEELIFDNFDEYEDHALEIFNQNLLFISELINSQDDVNYNSTYDSWKENLAYLQSHYETMTLNEENKEIIDYYIDTFSHVEELNALLRKNGVCNSDKADTNKMNTKGYVPTSQVSQARLNAAYYGIMNYNTYNPSYPHWSLDCANFISQCLVAGGKSMIGTEANNGANNMSYWFSHGTACDPTKVSETWRSATGFCIYWMNNSIGYSQFTSAQMVDGGAAFNYAVTGDAVSLLHTVGGYLVAYHTMIVIGATQSGQVKLAAHTSNVCNVLLSGMSCDGCIIYKVFN